MGRKMWKIVKAILADKRLVSVGFLLLVVFLMDLLFLRTIVSELDTFEHFLFGFVLSDLSSGIANSISLKESLNRRMGEKDLRQSDLLIRLLGFLLIGGVLWELSELFIFPALFGSTPDPFFNFPITLVNIDGTIDVIVGVIGCTLAWYLAE